MNENEEFHVVSVPTAVAFNVVDEARWLTTSPNGRSRYAAVPLGSPIPGECPLVATVKESGIDYAVARPSVDDEVAVVRLTGLVASWGLDPNDRVQPSLDELEADGPQWRLAAEALAALDRDALLGVLQGRVGRHEVYEALHGALLAQDAADPAVQNLASMVGAGCGRGFAMLSLLALGGTGKQRPLVVAMVAANRR